MPTISMFYGILIQMYFRDTGRHHLPHIHARYQGQAVALAVADGSVLEGELPARQLRMVQVWMDIHRDELLADWELAVNGDSPYKIAPLQ
ncbi:MAG: DUF4160 domain-containing protein [Sulfuritalea sp.]|nr:DUF4160 domain-containing protein [Sulfuritalea sp.]